MGGTRQTPRQGKFATRASPAVNTEGGCGGRGGDADDRHESDGGTHGLRGEADKLKGSGPGVAEEGSGRFGSRGVGGGGGDAVVESGSTTGSEEGAALVRCCDFACCIGMHLISSFFEFVIRQKTCRNTAN